MTEVLKAGVLSDEIDLGALAHNAAERAEVFVMKVGVTKPTNQPNSLPNLSLSRCGRRHGKSATSKTYHHGCKTTTFCTVAIGRRCPRSEPASNRCFAFTPKRVTFGHICWAALCSSPSPFISSHGHRTRSSCKRS
jgi:hypothetical protein